MRRALPYRRAGPPVGAPVRPVGQLFNKFDFYAGQTGTASGRSPLLRFHLLSRKGLRLNKFSSLGALPSSAVASDGLPLVTAVAAPRGFALACGSGPKLVACLRKLLASAPRCFAPRRARARHGCRRSSPFLRCSNSQSIYPNRNLSYH